MRRILIALIMVMCVAGCMVGPDYRRPAIDTPPAFRYEPKDVAETANAEWWKQFNDPVLDSLIAEALANNKNVKIAAANVEAAAGFLMTTRSALFPQVGYNATALRQRVSRNDAFPAPQENPFNVHQVLAGAT